MIFISKARVAQPSATATISLYDEYDELSWIDDWGPIARSRSRTAGITAEKYDHTSSEYLNGRSSSICIHAPLSRLSVAETKGPRLSF